MKILVLMALAIGSQLIAGVTINESINDVYYRGDHELMGTISMVVEGNDFAGVSPENPVFIEVELLKNAILADTLVDLNSEDTTLAQPIYLAMSPARNSGLQVIAPANSVSIVEWIAGEHSYWIKVQSDSSTWLQDGENDPTPPSPANWVSWSVGLSASQSASLQQYDGGNLPFNTRNLEAQHESEAVSTLHCANLKNSTLGLNGLDSLASYSVGAYSSEAEFPPKNFAAVDILDIEFTGSFRIGRGKNRNVWTVANTQLPESTISAGNDGWLTLEGVLNLNLTAVMVTGHLPTNLLPGTTITLLSEGEYGFAADGAAFWGPCADSGFAVVDEASAFEHKGKTLYREIQVTWNGDQQTLNGYNLAVQVQLLVPEGPIAKLPTLNWTLGLPNHQSELDLAPFNGEHQRRRCHPSFWKKTGSWQPGGDNNQDRVLAHVTRSDGNFSTDLVLTNPDQEQQGYLISGYDIDGNSLGTLAGALGPGQHLTLPAIDLYGDMSLSHLRFAAASSVRLGAVYRALGAGKATAHVYENAERATAWRLDQGEAGLTSDGLALVNLGNIPCQVVLVEMSNAGDTISETVITENLAPMGKLLHVITPKQENTHFVVRASEETAITALRASQVATYLWQSQAIPAQP